MWGWRWLTMERMLGFYEEQSKANDANASRTGNQNTLKKQTASQDWGCKVIFKISGCSCSS